jgi:DivIVA domain-containing protein
MLTSNEVRVAEFSTVRVVAGYEMAEVDDFLDRLADCLAAYEQGGSGRYLTADEVADAQFTATRIREGYRTEEVDELLDRALETLRGYEAAAAPTAAAAPPAADPLPPPSSPAAPAADPLAAPSPVTSVEGTAIGQPPMPTAEPLARHAAVGVPGDAAGAPPPADPAPAGPVAPVGPRPAATRPAAAIPGDYGLTVDDVVHRLQSLQAHQEAGLLNAPVQVRTPDGRTFTVAAVKSSTTGLVLTVSR